MSKTRVGVVGAGFFGQHHARHFAALDDVELVGIVDRDRQAAETLAAKVGCPAIADPNDLLDRVDAVSIVVPTVYHSAVACPFLERGIATFVEKPLALNVDEARAMVVTARRFGALLQVGHVERFNPAWSAVEKAGIHPTLVEARRFSRFPFRSLDVDVVFDVMIHDLDLILALVDAPVTRVEAIGERVLSPSIDRADARLIFANGTRASVAASRVHHETERCMRIWAEGDNFELDFFQRVSSRQRLVEPFRTGLARLPAQPSMEEKELLWQRMFMVDGTQHDRTVEPLRAELAHFVACAQSGDTPKVTGEQGYAAVCLAYRITEAIAHNTVASRKSA